ncbi:hypothetical protein, conserved [Eimeria necatrix]|uniref:Transmembrane protein n=1 Tax=Eimeria necatrix TaxID=51315 RepID=U6MSN0_9EIME|nr:hypothetical protein, conserved [Eimeria necatrix]CDJ66083.1 hypothetical protein, conserved [Eimeria necatrix]
MLGTALSCPRSTFARARNLSKSRRASLNSISGGWSYGAVPSLAAIHSSSNSTSNNGCSSSYTRILNGPGSHNCFVATALDLQRVENSAAGKPKRLPSFLYTTGSTCRPPTAPLRALPLPDLSFRHSQVPGASLFPIFSVHTPVSFSRRSFSSTSELERVFGDGYSAFRVPVRWNSRNLEFYVCGLDPDGALTGNSSATSAVAAFTALRPDLVFVGLGHLDLEKIYETFSREKLVRSGVAEQAGDVVKRDNGQFIPLIQHLLLQHHAPFYLIGRDRLVEMGALGQQLFWRPRELYGLVLKLIAGKKEKEKLTPSIKQVLEEDGSEFALLKVHQLLYEWHSTQKKKAQPQEFTESSFVKKWLIGRNKSECALRMRAKQLELAQPPLSAPLRSKLAWRILVVCDLAMQQRLALRLKHELTNLRGKEPMFERMRALEDTSATRFHLCLVLYLLLPLLTIFRLLWKAAKSAYIKYWVVGSTVSVSGDELLSRLSGGETAVGTEKENRAERRRKLEVVESRWMGLKHTVRDTSRD